MSNAFNLVIYLYGKPRSYWVLMCNRGTIRVHCLDERNILMAMNEIIYFNHVYYR